MNRGFGIALVASLITWLSFAAGGESRQAAGAAGRPGQPQRSIERFLDHILPSGTSGTLVAARGGKKVHCQGFGKANRKARIPATCDTVYDIMSMTKQFTAAAVLKLQMMGKLKVTDRMGKYIGPLPADKRDITLQQLLTHSSGLIGTVGDDYEPLSREDMLAGALASKLQSAPGAEYHYSNVGYGLLAAVIEKASGVVTSSSSPDTCLRRPGCDRPGMCCRSGSASGSRWSTTPTANLAAGRSTILGPTMGLTGTCAATAACSLLRATCCAGTEHYEPTRSSTNARSGSCSGPASSRSQAKTRTTRTGGSYRTPARAGSPGMTEAMVGPTASSRACWTTA